MSEAREKAGLAKGAARELAGASRAARERALVCAARRIREDADVIIAANARDLVRAREAGMSLPLQDRLMLDAGRISSIADSLDDIARQPDPLGRIVSGSTLENGLRVEQVSVPLGVVAMIYEARLWPLPSLGKRVRAQGWLRSP